MNIAVLKLVGKAYYEKSNNDNQQTYCEKSYVRYQRPVNKRILENFTGQDLEVRPSLTIMRGVVFRVIVVCPVSQAVIVVCPVIDDRQSILAFGQGVFGHCLSLTYRSVLQSVPTTHDHHKF